MATDNNKAKDLDKKLVLLTGASRGLGLAIATAVLNSGLYRVVAIARSKTPELTALIEAHEGNCYFYPFDLANTSGIKTLVSEVVKRHGRLYGLINNAALGSDGVLSTMHEEDIARTLAVNVTAPILLAKYAQRSMLLNQSGSIINIASIIASTGFSGLSVYGASKAALVGLTKSLAREVGRLGISINAIAPGFLPTSMTSTLNGEKLEKIRRRSALRTLACVDDIASVVLLLLSDARKSISGSVFTIDAGSTA